MASSLETSITSSVRARRRPARYSPELPQSEMSNGVLPTQVSAVQEREGDENSSNNNNEILLSALATVVYNGPTANNEMAPVVNNRGPGRPPSKHKKRKTSSGSKKKQAADESCLAAKRPRVANVLLENETLIDEIRVRKLLWMRTHESHHSTVHTTPYWEEVAQACDLTREYFLLFLFGG